MRVRKTVNVAFGVLAILLFLAGAIVYREHARHVKVESADHLRTMLMLRESVLRSYLESLRSEVILWSGQSSISEIMLGLNSRFERAGRAGVDEMASVRLRDVEGAPERHRDATLDERARKFAAHHRYHDIFFINEAGDILYTATKEKDLGTNLADGPYADSGLGRVYRELLESSEVDAVVFEDFSTYVPSAGEPAAFIGSPIHSGGRRIGFYVVQIPVEPIDTIMQFSAGMGETGETYVVGPDGLMRSDSRFFETSSILEKSVQSPTFERAMEGESGIAVVDDYRGVPVYSAYQPFDFEGTRWAVLAEQDVEEVEAPTADVLARLAAGYAGLVVIGLLLRFMLVHAVLPGALAAFFGLAALDVIDEA